MEENPFESIFNKMEKMERIKEEADKIGEKFSDKIENEILMDLWRNLGDLTPNYNCAFEAAKLFMLIKDAASDGQSETNIPIAVKAQVFRSAGACLIEMANMLEEMKEITEFEE